MSLLYRDWKMAVNRLAKAVLDEEVSDEDFLRSSYDVGLAPQDAYRKWLERTVGV